MHNRLANRLILALLVSLPFDYIPTLDVAGITIKLSSIFGAALITHTIWRIARGELRHPVRRVEYLLLLMSGIVAAGLLQSGLAGARTALPIAFLVLLALAISRQTRLDQTQIVRAIILGAVLACGFGLFQYFGNLAGWPESVTGLRQAYSWQGFGFPRMQSTFLEPLYFCSYLILPIVLLVARPVKKLAPKYRWAILLLLLVCAFMTLSRGGLAAIILALLCYAICNWRVYHSTLHAKNLAIGVLFAAISITVFFGIISGLARRGNDSDLTYNKSGIATVITHITNLNYFSSSTNKANDDSINQRAVARTEALSVLRSSPRTLLLGVGPGVYEATAQQKYGTTYANPGSAPIELALNFGLLGLLCIAALGASLLIQLLRQPRNPYDCAVAAYLIGVGFQSNAFSGIAITHIWVMIGLGAYSAYVRTNQTNQKTT